MSSKSCDTVRLGLFEVVTLTCGTVRFKCDGTRCGTREGKWRGNWQMDWVASTLHTTSEHGVSGITTITTTDALTLTASSRLNWCPRRFKWTRPFCQKTKSGFCVCAITFLWHVKLLFQSAQLRIFNSNITCFDLWVIFRCIPFPKLKRTCMCSATLPWDSMLSCTGRVCY
jgi:hypothetical protein